jgi:hemin uptake protein HemP
MSSKSKTKGNSWERDIVNHLSALYNLPFVRVPTSGAFIGGTNVVRKEILHDGQIRMMKGDIIPPDKWKHFNCEAKNYADFPFHQLVQGECKQLENWIGQLMEVADAGDINILMMKITRKGKFIVVPQADHWDNKLPHHVYHSVKHNYWQMFEYTAFWERHSKLVKTLSTKGSF